MISKITSTYNRITSTRFWYYLENILVVCLLFYCVKSLTDYDNVYYQTWKNEAAAKVVLSFTAIVFIIRRVKLFNWQSLVATLLFGTVVFERIHYWADSEDILSIIKPQMAAEWLSLMIIIDMILYKNVKNLFNGVNYLLILYILMTIGMIWRRHDRMDPIVLIFPMFLFALVKMDEEKTDWFIRRFIDGWFISYIYIVVKSFIERPYENDRYYGCFINIGHFGIFMSCCLIISFVSLYYSKRTNGIISFQFIISLCWMCSVLYMLLLINTRTILLSFIICLTFVYIYVRKDTSPKKIKKRRTIIYITYISIIILALVTARILYKVPDEWLNAAFSGRLSPMLYHIGKLRALGSFDNSQPLKEQLFSILDYISSRRLRIARNYSEFFNFDGNASIGVLVEEYEYWAYCAHNTYIQFLVEYGYISFVEVVILFIYSLIISIRRFLSDKKYTNLLPFLWITNMIGVWIGESSMFFYPETFFGLMFVSLFLYRKPYKQTQN